MILSFCSSLAEVAVLVGNIRIYAEVAQLVEHFPEEEGVAGSIPAPSTKLKTP